MRVSLRFCAGASMGVSVHAIPLVNRVGQNYIHKHTVCIHSISGRDITQYTVVNGAYTRFWPTLLAECGSKLRKTKTKGRLPLFCLFCRVFM
jgi:hypothetical protein